MSPWKILSKEGLSKGINSFGNSIKILGSQKTQSSDDFGCCCKRFSCGNCDSTSIEGELAYDTSGGLFTNTDIPNEDWPQGWGDVPFESTRVYKSPPVSAGKYKNEQEIGAAFAASIAGSFDAVAIKEGFTICIYQKENFEGDPFAVIKGPKVINNIMWIPKSQGGFFNDVWDLFSPSLEAVYGGIWPMYFSNVQMRGGVWQSPGSIVLCRISSTQVEQYGFGKLRGAGPIYTKENPLIE